MVDRIWFKKGTQEVVNCHVVTIQYAGNHPDGLGCFVDEDGADSARSEEAVLELVYFDVTAEQVLAGEVDGLLLPVEIRTAGQAALELHRSQLAKAMTDFNNGNSSQLTLVAPNRSNGEYALYTLVDTDPGI